MSHYNVTHTCERIGAQYQPIQHYWMYHTGWKERVGGFGFSTIDFFSFFSQFVCIYVLYFFSVFYLLTVFVVVGVVHLHRNWALQILFSI